MFGSNFDKVLVGIFDWSAHCRGLTSAQCRECYIGVTVAGTLLNTGNTKLVC